MVLDRCPFCEHGNPPDAVFCSHCGGQLDLAPCPKCGAVNKVSAEACYQCKAPIARPQATSPPTSITPAPSTARRTIERAAGVAAILLIVAIAWFASRGTSPPAPAPSAGGAAATGAGTIGTSPPATLAQPVKAVPAEPAKTEANEKTEAPAARRKARSEAAVEAPASAPATDSAPVAAESVPVPAPARTPRAEPAKLPAADVGTCTEAKAALGLCVMKDSASPAAGAAGPQAAKPAGQDSPRPEACTEAVAALGLCAPGTSTGRR